MPEDSKNKPIIITWKRRSFIVEATQYVDNEATCIVLLDPDSGGVELKVTVNLHKLSPHLVFIKDYSENRGIAAVMVGSQLVAPTGHTIASGAETIAQFVLLPRLAEAFNITLPEPKPVAQVETGASQAIAGDKANAGPQSAPQVPSDEDVGESPAKMDDFERQQQANRLQADKVAMAKEDEEGGEAAIADKSD